MNVWVVMSLKFSPYGKPMGAPEPVRVYTSHAAAEDAVRRWSDYNRHDKYWITCVKLE